MGVAEGDDRVLGHRHGRVGAGQPWHHVGDRVLDEAAVVGGEEGGDDLRVGGAAEGDPALLQLVPELDRVGEVAVVGEGELAAVVAPDRLGVLPGAAAGGRVADVADRHVALERPQLLLVEDLGDEPRVPHGGDVAALAGRDPGRLLAAMLERVETEVGETGDVMPWGVDAEDAAFLARTISVDHWRRVATREDRDDRVRVRVASLGSTGSKKLPRPPKRRAVPRARRRGRPWRTRSAPGQPAALARTSAPSIVEIDETGEGRRPLAVDAFLLQRRRDRLFPAREGCCRRGGQRRVLGTGQGGGGDRAADQLRVLRSAAAKDVAEQLEGLLDPALGERALDRLADLGSLEGRRLGRELALAAGEVVVDRPPRRLAARGDVAQLHSRVALLGQQPPGASEQPVTAVPRVAGGRSGLLR